MKVLITSSKNQFLLAPQILKCAKELNYEFVPTFYLDILFKFLGKGWLSKIIFRVLPGIIYNKINKQLLSDVDIHEPNVVWIFKGMEIYPQTLLKIKSRGIKLVNYNLDHPFIYHTRASGNSNVLKSLELYDLHFTYSNQIKIDLLKKYPLLKVVHLPFGFSSDVLSIEFDKLNELNKVCFIGFADNERLKFIKILSDNNIQVDVYGPRWNSILKNNKLKCVTAYPSVIGKLYYETIIRYRVQLNLLRPHNYLSHNMRSFEVPSVGGIMLTQETPEHLLYFKKNSEAFYFTDQYSMINEVNKIMNLSSDDAINIRIKAKSRSIASGYSYCERTNFAIKQIKQLL